MNRIIHVIGTGTLGEPLIGLLADHREALGIDEVTFYKRTPLKDERAKVNNLISRGAKLAVSESVADKFRGLGHQISYGQSEALSRATVVIDCTPAGNENKPTYEKSEGPLAFLAQGSEKDFGKPYAYGINDGALTDEDRFVQIVSCNTHNICSLVKTLAFYDGSNHLLGGNFVCMRRANDISQDDAFVPGPVVGKHSDEFFGTHHARDVSDLFVSTMGVGSAMPLFSSEIKLPTQYMHSIWFQIALDRPTTKDEVLERFRANLHVAITHKRSANKVFSFGRDHGYFGRILGHTVVCADSLAVKGRMGNEVVGYCFTPQDGNSLLSSVAAALRFIFPGNYRERLKVFDKFLFQEI